MYVNLYVSVKRYCVCVWLTVVTGGKVFILDLAAKIDQCAEYICKQQWGDLEFPPPFGREAFPEVMLCFVQVTHLDKRFQVIHLCKRYLGHF